MMPDSQQQSRIAARRRLGWALLLVGLGLLLVFVGNAYFGLEWLHMPHPYAYIAGLLGVLVLALLFRVWRCPRCGRHLGRLDAKFCTGCGLALTRQTVSDLSRRVHAEQVREAFRRLCDRLERLDALGRVVFLGGAIAGGGLFYWRYGMPGAFIDWVGLIGIGVAAGAIVSAGLHNVMMLAYWRCPACGKHLPFKVGGLSKLVGVTEITHCPNCRVELSEERTS